jgi:hypothetical protein
MLIGQKIEKTSDVLIFFKSDTHNPKVVVQHFNIRFTNNSNNPLTKKFKTKKAKEIKMKTD